MGGGLFGTLTEVKTAGLGMQLNDWENWYIIGTMGINTRYK